MSKCEEIERLLWDYPDGPLSSADKESVSGHLEKCAACRAALATIMAMKESKEADARRVSLVNTAAFDEKVMQKISKMTTAPLLKKGDEGYPFRMALSVGLAAAIAIFLILSVSDMQDMTLMKDRGGQPGTAEEEIYDRLDIRLAPEEGPPTPGKSEADEPDRAQEKEEFTSIPPSPAAVPAPDEGRRMVEKTIVAEAARQEKKKESFSILTSPVARPGPDSVNIDAVYLTDETVPRASQQVRASLSEVVVDTGMIQSAEPPRSMLVTVERMPVPVEVVPPAYPVWAKKRRLSGVVWVKARIDENGDVVEALIASSSTSGAGFEEASLAAAGKSKYLAAEANGHKIPVWIIYPVRFIYKN